MNTVAPTTTPAMSTLFEDDDGAGEDVCDDSVGGNEDIAAEDGDSKEVRNVFITYHSVYTWTCR
jgi:hypothetical protein